jgi:ribosomal protein S18 acetylase RimI-like enzyme
MNHELLHNPVFNALCTGDAALSNGRDDVKYFDEMVSPFVGIRDGHENGFTELYMLLPKGRRILFATPEHIHTPVGWQLMHKIAGVQMIFKHATCDMEISMQPQPLNEKHIDAMVELATLTKPGPFDKGTILFGNYHGFFEGEKLVAMTGQRLHPQPYSEVSAVCTHPDHAGKGYAHALVAHQTKYILEHKQIPMLHVRADNARAIALYERIGYAIERGMNFYFMIRS